MTGPWEQLLTGLAESSPYDCGHAFSLYSSIWESAGAVHRASACDPGMRGASGDAAAARLRELSQLSASFADAARRASTLISHAEIIRGRAQNALGLLPSVTPPQALREMAASAELDDALADAFVARREWAAKRHAESAATQLTTLGSHLSEVAEHLTDSPEADLTPAGTVTADGRFRIGPPMQPTYKWDEDFLYGSDVASFEDFMSSEKWKATLAGAGLMRPDLSDATEAYAHYWSNTGDDWFFDYEKAYRDDSGVRADIDQQIASAQKAAEELIGIGNSSFSFTGQPSTTSHYPATENWQKAIGGHQQWSSGNVIVYGGTATMTVTVHADDHYNFNRGQADIASNVPDEENGRFAEIGWAKPFDSSGSVTRTVTWTVGDPLSMTVLQQANEGR